MMDYMQKERCGNSDLEYSEMGDKCTDQKSPIDQPMIQNTVAFEIPTASKRDASLVAESTSYYLEVDVKFTDVTKSGRSRSIFLGFNYDELNANGNDTPLELVALRFMHKKLCAQFLTLSEGKFFL